MERPGSSGQGLCESCGFSILEALRFGGRSRVMATTPEAREAISALDGGIKDLVIAPSSRPKRGALAMLQLRQFSIGA